MCESKNIQYYPSRTLGGPTGDYSMVVNVPNGRVAEFMLVNIANGDAGVSKVIVSGQSAAAARSLNWAGGVTLNDDNIASVHAYSLAASSSVFGPMIEWEAITNSQKKVFIHIDTVGSNSVFVTLRFRIRELEIVPGPATTVHHDHAQELNIARADNVRQRLEAKREIAQGESLNASKRP